MAKIVFDYQVFSWQKYGGISRYIYEVATHLSKSEALDVKILAMAYVNNYLKSCPSGLVVGFPVPDFPSKKYHTMLGNVNDKVCEILLNNSKPDIVHKTYYSKTSTPKGSRVVITVHDMTHEKLSQFFQGKGIFTSSDNTSLAKQEAVKEADLIICVSENTKKDLIEILGVSPRKVYVVYHGTSLKFSENYPDFDASPYSPYIFYVGDRGGYKNFQRFLQGYASSSRLRNNFNIVCFGGGPISRDELSLINALGLPKNKVFQVSGGDVALANFYRKASVFVYPSLYEGFGIPLLEAMTVHCPIACSNTSSMPEVVGDAAELFDPYDMESIADALEKVLFSPQKTEELVKLGTERIKCFSWSACAEQTKQVYLSLL